jgi:hypothetical protein
VSQDADADADAAAFAASRAQFEQVLGFLTGLEATALTHAHLEEHLGSRGRDLIKQLMQDHLDLRASRETPVPVHAPVTGADLVTRTRIETGHQRCLASVFGAVTVTRIGYRAPGAGNLYPADAQLNLPTEKHSHGLRQLAAIEASRGSYDDATEAISRATGQQLGKRQIEQLAHRAAADFDSFYTHRQPPHHDNDSGDTVVVLSCDGKGVVMRPDALRPATAHAAATSTPKLSTRLSPGEKRHRKRLAEVGAVYDITPAPRTPADILPTPGGTADPAPAPGPVATRKWLTASIVDDTATVIGEIFAEADRRDPDHQQSWIALVDGNNHQIEQIENEAGDRHLPITILIDFIHVLEYLWAAAWSLHTAGDPAAETWVRRHATDILHGNARQTAATIRGAATRAGLHPAERAGIDKCATYLTNKHRHLDYPTALKQGWPIATGVIEGACRHLVKDRMDLTGARWGLDGAEAILKLRALRCNGDWDEYWTYHLNQEQHRIHETRYANNIIPHAA